ncbi:MAG TPA: hypothetical protein ENK59_07080, partial [Thioploca sp.]|nr:hypothetical protein [Thioploca sp.]
MKKIVKIFFVMLTISLAFTSCEDDNSAVVDFIDTEPKTVSFNESQLIVDPSATAFNLPIAVSPSNFSGNFLIEYTINGVGASQTFSGGQAAQIPLDVSELGTIYDLVIDRVTVIGTEVGVIDGSKNAARVVVAPEAPPVNADELQLILAWPDAANNDLDFVVTDADTFIVDNSQSTSAGEDIALPNAQPDGNYRVFVRNWTSALDPIPF